MDKITFEHYEKLFSKIPFEEKKEALSMNPAVDWENLKTQPRETIERVYFMIYSQLDMICKEHIGRSIYGENALNIVEMGFECGECGECEKEKKVNVLN